MKNILPLLIFILTMISGTCFAQQVNDNINIIEFKFIPGRRSDYREVTIRLTKNIPRTINREFEVHAKLLPINNDDGKTSKVDTFFTIDKKVFVDLLNELVPILNKIDVTKFHPGIGFDGTSCTIEYGNFSGKVAYKFWSPDYETEQRGLTDFIRICKKIVEIGGLNPKKILGY